MDKKLLSLMKKAAISGGDVLLKHFNKVLDVRQKGEKDFVTNVDIESERVIIKIIENIFPKHNILSEEKGRIDKKSEYTWIVDPLDGTGNYIRRIPIFGVSLALEHKGIPVMGIVHLPMTKEVIYAFKGDGAYYNDQKMGKLPASKKRSEELFITFCHGHRQEDIKKMMDYFQKIRPHVADMRKLGASTLEIISVAKGTVDAYIAPGLPLWDFKAAALIVEEVGGAVRETKDGTIFIFAPGVENILRASLR